jgi:rRNA-processing protein FCF1
MTTIYLDTSVAITESFLMSPYCEAFFKACAILQYTVAIPEIVIDELKGNYPKKLQEKYASFQKAKKELGKLVEVSASVVTTSDAVDAYGDWLDELIEKHGVVVTPYPDVSPKELVQQSYELKRPFKDSGDGHKDYVIWKSILTHLRSAEAAPPNIFLTNNTKDFCDTDGNGNHILHPDLSEQIDNLAHRPSVYTSIKSAFETELSPHLEGMTLDDIPDLGPNEINAKVEEFLLEDLPGRSAYGLEGVPFSNEITISSVGSPSIDSVALKRVNDEVVISVIGSVEVEVDGFIDKSDYYMSEGEDQNMYVVDGNWNDHVMMVSSTVATTFEMTIFYATESGEVTGHEIALPDEIQDEWPYK